MCLDWNSPDLAFLRRQLECGNVILFAGAGFSVDATNARGESPPVGSALTVLLADRAGFAYAGEPLGVVYDVAQKSMGTHALRSLLRSLYKVSTYQAWYRTVRTVIWRRIYTTNIDDLVEQLYRDACEQRLRTIVCPSWPEERDPLFCELQCVHLHGHVDYPSQGLTFSFEDFARETAQPNPWYQHLVDDLYHYTFLFVGTYLEESPFHHYLELREEKEHGVREWRPKSYLVNPSVGAIRARALANRNIVTLECTAAELFDSLANSVPLDSFTIRAVREKAFPNEFRSSNRDADDSVNRYFELVRPDTLPTGPTVPGEPFFLGAEPTWGDIRAQHDGAREVNERLAKRLMEPAECFVCVVLHGPAGSGKTTCLMRVAYSLGMQGAVVFHTKGLERIDLSGTLEIAAESRKRRERVYVFVDVMSRQIGSIDQARDRLKRSRNLTLVLAGRSNTYYSRCQAVADLHPIEIRMPDLAILDIESILDRLAKFGFLGVLRDQPRQRQIEAFKERANKQLLVAMREATSGRGFDAILRGEFSELPEDGRLAYTICCLAMDKGAPGVYRRHLTACIPGLMLRKSVLFDDVLRGVLVAANQSGSMLKARHRLIAHWVAHEIAPGDAKREATVTFLKQISSDIAPNEIRRRSPAYLAYRGMINADGLFDTFNMDAPLILDVFEELRPYYDHDFLFWLQYGIAHIKAGHLDVGENFLNQSLAMKADSHQTLHHMGILYLMQATQMEQLAAAEKKAEEGTKLLHAQIQARGDIDSYPYAAYLTYVARWYERAGESIPASDWEALRAVGQEASNKYRFDDVVQDAIKEMEKAYLMRVVKR